MQRIFVTGGNSGSGFALCRQLAVEHKCHVLLGARSVQKGQAAVSTIKASAPEAKIDFVQIDVSDSASIASAAQAVQQQLASDKLYAVVNNAGTGLQHGVSAEVICAVNIFGVKQVCEAFLPLLSSTGRIVNVGSGAGPMFMNSVATQAEKKAFMDPNVTWDTIDGILSARRNGLDARTAYGLTKAALSAYTSVLARTYPNITSSSISPGFIDTAIVSGWGATKPAEEGTVSIKHCLFATLDGNGFYYGSDGVRSPLHVLRNPGEPAYTGSNYQ
jgi:NAD(P)-dependent dehydrogenase (short-subunit alcohol dehydrogenase family)